MRFGLSPRAFLAFSLGSLLYTAGAMHPALLSLLPQAVWGFLALWAAAVLARQGGHRAPWVLTVCVLIAAAWLTRRTLEGHADQAALHAFTFLVTALAAGSVGAALGTQWLAPWLKAGAVCAMCGWAALAFYRAPNPEAAPRGWALGAGLTAADAQQLLKTWAPKRIAGDAEAGEWMVALQAMRGADLETLRVLCPKNKTQTPAEPGSQERALGRRLCAALAAPLPEVGAQALLHPALPTTDPSRLCVHRVAAALWAEAGNLACAQHHAAKGGPQGALAQHMLAYRLGLGPRPVPPWSLPIALGVGPTDAGLVVMGAPGTLEILAPFNARPTSWLLTTRYPAWVTTPMPTPNDLPTGAHLCVEGHVLADFRMVFTGTMGTRTWQTANDPNAGLPYTLWAHPWSLGCITLPKDLGQVQAVTLHGPWLLGAWSWHAPEATP